MEGREGYLVLGQRYLAEYGDITIVAAIGSVLFAGAMLYYARNLLLPATTDEPRCAASPDNRIRH